MDQETLKQIKQDYCEQLFLFYGDDHKATRNIDKILRCKFIEDATFGASASTDLETNTITYGPQIPKHVFYHELDHIRKGNPIYTQSSKVRYIHSQNGQLKCYISIPQEGVFFNEGITEYMAQKMFQNSKVFKNFSMNNGEFYERQLQVIDELSKKLSVSGLELCRLIDLKQHFKDNHEIDDLLKNNSCGQVNFDELQGDLDWWGSWQKQDLACQLGHVYTESDDGHKERVYGVHEKMKELAEQKFSHAYFMVEHIKTQEPIMQI